MAHQVHQVGGVLAVVDGEGRSRPMSLGVFAQQPRADAVEGAGPGERVGVAPLLPSTLRVMRSTRRAISRGAPRERHQQDAARIGAVDDEMRDAMRERVGLARARAGDDQQRRARARSRSPTPCSTARRCCGLSFSRWARAMPALKLNSGFVHKRKPCAFLRSQEAVSALRFLSRELEPREGTCGAGSAVLLKKLGDRHGREQNRSRTRGRR